MTELIARTQPPETTQEPRLRLDGVVIGILVGLDENRQPLLAFPGNPSKEGLIAKSTIQLTTQDVGAELALLFVNADPRFPVVIGRMHRPGEIAMPDREISAELDGERLTFSAQQEIVLKCGKASITLTRSGKVILRGSYLLSRSSGVNRIKGGSVQIN